MDGRDAGSPYMLRRLLAVRLAITVCLAVFVAGCAGVADVREETATSVRPQPQSASPTPSVSPAGPVDAQELVAFADAYTQVRSDHITRDGFRQRNPRWTPAPLSLGAGTRGTWNDQLQVADDTEQQIGRLKRTPLTREFIEAAIAAIQTERRAIERALDATYFPDNSRDQVELFDQSDVLSREA